MRAFLLAAALLPLAAIAADPKPEIQRPAAPPQANGALHSLRLIPEACVRIQGMFTGDPAQPYRFDVVRSSPNCQPRAKLVDAAKANPSIESGWKFNDLIRVPSAACPQQQAVVRIWRKPVDQVQQPDGQGQTRIYLQESRQAAAAGKLAAIPVYAAEMGVVGKACN